MMAKRFKSALDNFTQALGALINNTKSNVYAWNTPLRTAHLIASIFRFPLIEKWQTFRYLGIPICLKSLPNSAWNQVLEKLKNKMDHWGAFWLNLAGRTVLIKSVLSMLPIFQFSSLLAPQNVKNSISILLRCFIWEGGKTEKKKYHLIKWDIVKHPNESGGLGIKDLGLSNLAMGAKILWNLVSGRNDWWKRILKAKYLIGDRLRGLDQHHSLNSGSPIGKLVLASIPLLQSQLTWIPENGRKILIGIDSIMDKQPLWHHGQTTTAHQLARHARQKTYLGYLLLACKQGRLDWMEFTKHTKQPPRRNAPAAIFSKRLRSHSYHPKRSERLGEWKLLC